MWDATVIKKICTCCKLELGIDRFYKKKSNKDGLYQKCKDCTLKEPSRKKAVKKYKSSDRYKEKRKKHDKKYFESELGRQAQLRNRKKVQPKNELKSKIRRKTQYLVDIGKIKKMPCNVCGKEKSEAHHLDYIDPLNIVWLCSKHHKEWHRRGAVYYVNQEEVDMIYPLQDRVLIKPDEKEETTAGGIILPNNPDGDQKPGTGTIIQVGPGRLKEDNQRHPIALEKGQQVVYACYAGTGVKIDGVDHLIMKEDDVMGVIGERD